MTVAWALAAVPVTTIAITTRLVEASATLTGPAALSAIVIAIAHLIKSVQTATSTNAVRTHVRPIRHRGVGQSGY